jgi:hypothetical protein
VRYFIVVTAIAASFGLGIASANAADKDAADAPFGKPAVSDQAMAQLRGGAEASQSAINSGVCVNCSVDGTAIINGNAFGNAAGLITVIQNTGVNAVLQNATVVNVNIH